MSILSLIPFGSENAVTRPYLVAKCFDAGLIEVGCKDPDRRMRQLVSEARHIAPVLSTGTGYFRPTERDKEHLRKYIRREDHRAKKILVGMNTAKALLSDFDYERNKLEGWEDARRLD